MMDELTPKEVEELRERSVALAVRDGKLDVAYVFQVGRLIGSWEKRGQRLAHLDEENDKLFSALKERDAALSVYKQQLQDQHSLEYANAILRDRLDGLREEAADREQVIEKLRDQLAKAEAETRRILTELRERGWVMVQIQSQAGGGLKTEVLPKDA